MKGLVQAMKRKLCIVVCCLCLVMALAVGKDTLWKEIPGIGETIQEIAGKGKTLFTGEDKKIYEKGIQYGLSESQGIEGTNLTFLEAEKEREEEKIKQYIENCIQNMTLEEKLAQMMILTNQSDITRQNIKKYQPGGILFFAADFNGKTVKGVRKRVKKLQADARYPMFVGVDEEGGSVSRIAGLKNTDVPVFTGARTLYQQGKAEAVAKETRLKVEFLKSMGINLNFNPVADVVSSKNSYMYERSASGKPMGVSEYVKTVVTVSKENDMGSCLKHFPGYGNNKDTHVTYTEDNRELARYQKRDFLPFQEGIRQGADMVMVAHIVMRAVDKKNPASLSKKVHEILRDDMDFQGVIIADDLNMQAILQNMTIEKASAKALIAGNDMIFSADLKASMRGMKRAVKKGKLSEEQVDESVRRILRMKINRKIIELE